ncbi:MAG: DUF4863 family protein, partial [Aquincola sp.]|nr:DUF4863 family protein [Aquincola sp.]
MSQALFHQRIAQVAEQIAGRPLDDTLAQWLNTELGADSDTYRQLKQLCLQGVAEGWLCQR